MPRKPWGVASNSYKLINIDVGIPSDQSLCGLHILDRVASEDSNGWHHTSTSSQVSWSRNVTGRVPKTRWKIGLFCNACGVVP